MSINELRSMLTACCMRPVGVIAALCMLALPATVQAQGPVVVSQVYGGGNNATAAYRDDYVELFNRSCVPVDISTWSIQKATSIGSAFEKQNIPPGTILLPGQYYLMQFTRFTTGTAVGAALPVAPDSYAPGTGTSGSSTDIAATSFKIALVRNQTVVSAVVCPNTVFANGVVDMVTVGTGGSACEGTVFPTLAAGNNLSVARKLAGAQDTNVNSADFTSQVATTIPPRNMFTALNPGGTSTGFGSCVVAATGVCTILNAADCTTAGGVYTDCQPCTGRGACCLSTGCVIAFQAECTVLGGSFVGQATTCYTMTTGTNGIETITTPITGPTGDDTASAVITLPFTFIYFGQNKTQLSYSTNGNVQFGATTSNAFADLRFPNTATPNDALAALWDDLNVDASSSTQHGVIGATPGSRKFAITWNNVLDRTTGGARYNVQVVLFENTNTIEFRYGTFAQELFGGDFSIGLENSTGLVGQYLYSRNITSNSSVNWSPNACPPATGACCLTGVCSIAGSVSCGNLGGAYAGNGTSCDPDPCVTGACCQTSGICGNGQTSAQCTGAGGIWRGTNSTCETLDPVCAPVGACCSGAVCAQAFQVNCVSGIWFANTSCSPNPCTGSCCDAVTGACSITAGATACGVGNTYTQFGTCGTITYTVSTTATAWEDISGDVGVNVISVFPGTNLSDDGVSPAISIPFSFSFYGNAKTSIFVGANGLASFVNTNVGAFSPTVPLPNVATPNDGLYPLWRDLHAGQGTAQMHSVVRGTAPFRRFIISWKNIPTRNVVDSNSFQIALYETSNSIEFRYGAIAQATTTAVGIENSAGTVGNDIAVATLGTGGTARLFSPAGNPCTQPLGACCESTTCNPRSYGECQAISGAIWKGYIACNGGLCLPTGGCCSATGGCSTTDQTSCEAVAGSVYNGNDVPCQAGVNCITGNCCTAAGVCNLKTAAGCALAPAGYFSAGTCTGTPCPTGACCSDAGNCTVVITEACPIGSGYFRWTSAASCSPNLCVGRCCLGDGTCSVTTETACGGTYGSDGSSCSPTQVFSGSPFTVPDNTPAGTSSILTVAPSFPIVKATVSVSIPAHTYIGDLTLKITHGTTEVVLWGRAPTSGCSADNLTATFDDAGTVATCVNGPQGMIQTSGTGAGLLSAFNGQLSDGDWTLFVSDSANGDIGPVVSWSVNLEAAAPPCQGACCSNLGTCTYTGPANCPGGDFRGLGVACTPNPCVPSGACCSSTGVCTVTDHDTCVAASGSEYISDGSTCDPTPCVTGRCCTATGVCSIRTAIGCQVLGGFYAGATTTCVSDPCPAGACCADSGSCTVIIEAVCPVGSGAFRWTSGGSCLPNLCVGRCCALDGTCSVGVASACNGTYGGDGSECTSVNVFTLNPNEAIPDNSIVGVTSGTNTPGWGTVTNVEVFVNIPDHTYIGDLDITLTHGSTTRTLKGSDFCNAGGLTVTFSDAGTPFTCVGGPQGTRKISSGLLADFAGVDSGGGPWTLFVKDVANGDTGTLLSWSLILTTDRNPCPQPLGACCTSTACTIVTHADCDLVPGIWQGGFSACPGAPSTAAATPSASPCPGLAVSLSGTIGLGETLTWHEGTCDGTVVGTGSPVIVNPTADTTYYAVWSNGSCVSDCIPVSVTVNAAMGACCNGYGIAKTCTVTLATACGGPTTPSHAYRGDCTTCGPTSCCPSDYNNSGTLQIPDVFAFLDDWFAGAITTDFNNGGTLQIQDIFDFLTHWFGSC